MAVALSKGKTPPQVAVEFGVTVATVFSARAEFGEEVASKPPRKRGGN